jgi:hypothetical protein
MAPQDDTVGPAPVINTEFDKSIEKSKDAGTGASEDAPATQDLRGLEVMRHQAIHQIWTKGPLIAVFAG